MHHYEISIFKYSILSLKTSQIMYTLTNIYTIISIKHGAIKLNRESREIRERTRRRDLLAIPLGIGHFQYPLPHQCREGENVGVAGRPAENKELALSNCKDNGFLSMRPPHSLIHDRSKKRRSPPFIIYMAESFYFDIPKISPSCRFYHAAQASYSTSPRMAALDSPFLYVRFDQL